ncbi:SHOCT domain-containing protein [Amycolatopsis cynarae]|uniref:SHOCT domain-containing protein n=1 Tax=Amycolatopsis cynarae TaxID=2995223 RepID=A0ABY7AXI5_9PSEU|nr:SHOCT domain-containing protein [Amycolatopsis sp. HUAS 11-8]WAL64725.1 SHOCT domain-containing protein [Amycolatopsis sp. HUAS 11-8]
MMFWGGYGMGGWGYGLSMLAMVLFWGAVIAGIVALVRHTGRTSRHQEPATGTQQHTPGQTPEQTLAERFARGEIDEDEYRRRLEVLRSGAAHPGTGEGR